MERWVVIDSFPGYSVSDWGRVRNDNTGRIMRLSQNLSGLVHVGMMRDGVQLHRSLPRLVAKAFLESPFEAFDTPINLDGDRLNNYVDNLAWRPRWFAVRYHQQFHHPYEYPILYPIQNVVTGEVCENSIECAKRYGVLEEDLVMSILNRTYAWPLYQEFRVLED